MHKATRIARNAASLLTSDALNRATTFALYMLVGRQLGAHAFGQFSLALTFFYLFQVIAAAGIKTPIIREVSKDKSKTNAYLINGSLIVFAFSLAAVGVLALVVSLMGYSGDTGSIVLLLSAALLPFGLSSVSQGIFQAWERMNYLPYANIPVNIVKVALSGLLLWKGYGVFHLILLLIASHTAVCLFEWALIIAKITRPRLEFDLRFCWELTRDASTFLGIEGVVAFRSSFATILLSKIATEVEVGLFSAATQLLIPFMLVYQSIIGSVFPILCRRFKSGFDDLKKITESLVELLLIITFPVIIGFFFLGDTLLLLFYGNQDFMLAFQVMRVAVWGLLLQALTYTLGNVLFAIKQEKTNLRIVLIHAVTTIPLTFVLVSNFGLIGAPVAGLCGGVINFSLHYLSVSKALSSFPFARLLWQPLISCLFMAAYLLLLNNGSLLQIVPSLAVYTIVLVAVAAISAGGFTQLKAKYLHL